MKKFASLLTAAALMFAAPAFAGDTIHTAIVMKAKPIAEFLKPLEDGHQLMTHAEFVELNPKFAGSTPADIIPMGTKVNFRT